MEQPTPQHEAIRALTSGAFNATTALQAAHQQVVKDPFIEKLPEDIKRSPMALTTFVAIQGNQGQKIAINRAYSMDDTFNFPEIAQLAGTSIENRRFILSTIKAKILELCGSYGVEYKGQASDLAFTVLAEYGSLTILDLLKFTEQAKADKYRDKYDNVPLRGINRQYYLTWLSQYMVEKGMVWDSIVKNRRHQQENQDVLVEQSKGGGYQLKGHKQQSEEFQRARLLERQADELREQHLYKKVKQEIKEKQFDKAGAFLGYKTIEVEILESKLTGYLLLHDFFSVHFGRVVKPQASEEVVEELADSIIKKITAHWKAAYEATEAKDLPFEAYCSFKAKQLHTQLYKVAVRHPSDILMGGMLTYAKQESVEKLAQVLFKNDQAAMQVMGHNAYTLAAAVTTKYINIFKRSYLGYIKQSIKTKVAPIVKREYLALSARACIYNATGHDLVHEYLIENQYI